MGLLEGKLIAVGRLLGGISNNQGMTNAAVLVLLDKGLITQEDIDKKMEQMDEQIKDSLPDSDQGKVEGVQDGSESTGPSELNSETGERSIHLDES